MACTSRQVRQGLCVCEVGVCVREHSCIIIAGPHWEVVVVGTCMLHVFLKEAHLQ